MSKIKKKIKRVSRSRRLTPAEVKEDDRVRALVQKDFPPVKKTAGEAESAIAKLLRSQRKKAKLTLGEIQKRTGINKSNVSKIENCAVPTFTVDTLSRLAEAMGLELVVTFKAKAKHKTTKRKTAKKA